MGPGLAPVPRLAKEQSPKGTPDTLDPEHAGCPPQPVTLISGMQAQGLRSLPSSLPRPLVLSPHLALMHVQEAPGPSILACAHTAVTVCDPVSCAVGVFVLAARHVSLLYLGVCPQTSWAVWPSIRLHLAI